MDQFEQYEHHGKQVWVRADLKGKHREHCLCYSCERFWPGSSENCFRAKLLHLFCRLFGMVTPVWECGRFIAKQRKRYWANEDLPPPPTWDESRRRC